MDTLGLELHHLELLELASLLEKREVSPIEVTYAQLERIAALDGRLGSYARLMAESAIAQAQSAEAEIAAGRYRGPLHGIPIGIKDLCATKGTPTAAGMAIHRGYVPIADATVVSRLKDAGAVILGKHQLTEGAYSDHHPSVPPPKNPWNPDYWPGISSSGGGVATAAALCYGAIASDTGGSIRWPSAANGVSGLKPTWGRVSRHGVFALAPTLDHVGTMARSAADAAVLLRAIAGGDPADPTALPEPVPDYLAAMGQGIGGMRIGIDAEWNSIDVDPATHAVLSQAANVFRDFGCELVDVRFPDVTGIVNDWAQHCAVEAAVSHQNTYPARQDEYGPVLASVLESGRRTSGADYQQIILRRMNFRGQVRALFRSIDLLLIPVHPFGPLDLTTIGTLGEQPQLIPKLQRFTSPFNMTGNPTITLPGGFSEAGMPIALQLVAAHLDEAALIRAGAAFQSVTSWHRRHPAV